MNKSLERLEAITSFQKLQKRFDAEKNNIELKENKFDKLRENFLTSFHKETNTLISGIGKNNPLQKLGKNLSQQLDAQLKTWEQQIKQRQKGTKFRQGFDDSLLVFVYGKVKSGKSSLGNYVAWGHSQPSPELKNKNSLHPEYFTSEQTDVKGGDKENEAEKNLQFRVGATEATSSIQGFRLPGLTWVDSPGLHSVNETNGELAKEYVKHADLILYVMNSQAPGRATDMAELTELINNRKKVMVLLTGSDTTEEDEDENGDLITRTIMKPIADQQLQISYVQGELKKLHNNSSILSEVLPISTRYAEINPTPIGAMESGIGRLMYELRSICESQALEIKLNTPMNNLRNSIESTQKELGGLLSLTEKIADEIKQQSIILKREIKIIGMQGVGEMRSFINHLFSKNLSTSELEEALFRKLIEVIDPLIAQAVQKIGEQQHKTFGNAFDRSTLASLPAYKETEEERQYMIVESGNKKSRSLLGAIAGGTIGFFMGGPAGAAIGAGLGSSAGSALGRGASSSMRSHKVVVGDNREEQRAKAMAVYADAIPLLLEEQINSVYMPLESSVLSYCKNVSKKMEHLQNDLRALEDA